MSSPGVDELLDYYIEERRYLREQGRSFQERYPKLARRLSWSDGHTTDPHVDRLLESFAFLTARVQYNIEQSYPEIPSAVLDILYPFYTCPVPAMAIARLAIDPASPPPPGYAVPRESRLFATTSEGHTCWFQTCYDLTLWPIEIVDVSVEEVVDGASARAGAALAIALRALGGATFADLGLETLRLHIDSESGEAWTLHEWIWSRVQSVEIQSGEAIWSSGEIQPVGFDDAGDESLFPAAPRAHPAYRLLREYFALPEKFLFFDVAGLDLQASGEEITIRLIFAAGDELPRDIELEPSALQLHCAPVANLFTRSIDPIRNDHTRTEFKLVADRWRGDTVDVHSVLEVASTSNISASRSVYQPFYGDRHAGGDAPLWCARRRADPEGGSSDVWLSFIDGDLDPAAPADDVIFVRARCTNGTLAPQLYRGAPLSHELDVSLSATLRSAPTEQLEPPLDGDRLWKLISHLSLNHLSLATQSDSDDPTEPSPGLSALQEMLRLYDFSEDPAVDNLISGLVQLGSQTVTARIHQDGAADGFARGLEIELLFDEDYYEGDSAFLLSGVLARFFALYVTINSFVRASFTSRQRTGFSYTWPIHTGERLIL